MVDYKKKYLKYKKKYLTAKKIFGGDKTWHDGRKAALNSAGNATSYIWAVTPYEQGWNAGIQDKKNLQNAQEQLKENSLTQGW